MPDMDILSIILSRISRRPYPRYRYLVSKSCNIRNRRIGRRPDGRIAVMATSRIYPGQGDKRLCRTRRRIINGPASRTCHRHVIDISQTGRCFLRVPRRGARGRNKAAAEGEVQRRGGWKPARSGGGGSPVRGGVRRLHGARGVTESFGKTAGKPRENRVSGAGNFRKSRFSVFSAPASMARIRHMRGAGMRGRAADPAPGDKYRWKTNGCGIICRTTGFQTTWGGSPGPSRRSTRRCRR